VKGGIVSETIFLFLLAFCNGKRTTSLAGQLELIPSICIGIDDGVELSKVVCHPVAFALPTALFAISSIGSSGIGACALVTCPICYPSRCQVMD